MASFTSFRAIRLQSLLQDHSLLIVLSYMSAQTTRFEKSFDRACQHDKDIDNEVEYYEAASDISQFELCLNARYPIREADKGVEQ